VLHVFIYVSSRPWMDCYISAGMASFILLPTGKVFVTNFENLKNKIVIILCAFSQ